MTPPTKEDLEAAGTTVGEELGLSDESMVSLAKDAGGHGSEARGGGGGGSRKPRPSESVSRIINRPGGPRDRGATPEKARIRAQGFAQKGQGSNALAALKTPDKILTALYHGLEDSNFHTLNIEVEKLGKPLGMEYGSDETAAAVGLGLSQGHDYSGYEIADDAVKALRSLGHTTAADQLSALIDADEMRSSRTPESPKLQGWAAKWPYAVTKHKDGSLSVPDSGHDEPLRAELWQMPDYRVTSVSAGTIRLMPKSKLTFDPKTGEWRMPKSKLTPDMQDAQDETDAFRARGGR